MSAHPPSLEEAITLFNQRQFFECHEVLEDLWRPLSPGAEKQFLQGVLQVGVGFHHLLNNNYIGAKNLLQAGLERLETVEAQNEYIPPVALKHLISTCREALQTVLELKAERLAEFPDRMIPLIRFLQPQ